MGGADQPAAEPLREPPRGALAEAEMGDDRPDRHGGQHRQQGEQVQRQEHHEQHQEKGLKRGFGWIKSEGGPGGGLAGAVMAPVQPGKEGGLMGEAMGGVEKPVLQDQHQHKTDPQIPPAVLVRVAVEPCQPMGPQLEHARRGRGKDSGRLDRQADVRTDRGCRWRSPSHRRWAIAGLACIAAPVKPPVGEASEQKIAGQDDDKGGDSPKKDRKGLHRVVSRIVVVGFSIARWPSAGRGGMMDPPQSLQRPGVGGGRFAPPPGGPWRPGETRW